MQHAGLGSVHVAVSLGDGAAGQHLLHLGVPRSSFPFQDSGHAWDHVETAGGAIACLLRGVLCQSMLQMAFLENAVFVPIQGFSSILLSGLSEWLYMLLLPPALLSLADTCKKITTVSWQVKDGEK